MYNVRAIEADQDPDTLVVDPLGPQDKQETDDRLIEKVDLDLDEAIKPSPEFNHLTIMLDQNLSRDMKDQLAALICRFTVCSSFEGRRLGDVDMPPMKINPTAQPSGLGQAYRESPRTSKRMKEALDTLKEWTQTKGCHQFRVAKEDQWLTAFISEREGLWQYKRLPFGLQNAPAFMEDKIWQKARHLYLNDQDLMGHWHDAQPTQSVTAGQRLGRAELDQTDPRREVGGAQGIQGGTVRERLGRPEFAEETGAIVKAQSVAAKAFGAR